MSTRSHRIRRHSWYPGLWFILAATVCFAPGKASADQAVVLASTVPDYPPGMVVAATDTLNLSDGATATLLFESGDMLRLRGPFKGTIGEQEAQAGESTTAAIAAMFRLHGVDASIIGGTRSLAPARIAVALDDVRVDPRRSSTYCVKETSSVWIGRPSGDPLPAALQRSGRNRTLGWPAGADRIEWPADVPIEDGSQFAIVTNGLAPTMVTFREMPADTGRTQIAKGILLGCHDQFDEALRLIRPSTD